MLRGFGAVDGLFDDLAQTVASGGQSIASGVQSLTQGGSGLDKVTQAAQQAAQQVSQAAAPLVSAGQQAYQAGQQVMPQAPLPPPASFAPQMPRPSFTASRPSSSLIGARGSLTQQQLTAARASGQRPMVDSSGAASPSSMKLWLGVGLASVGALGVFMFLRSRAKKS